MIALLAAASICVAAAAPGKTARDSAYWDGPPPVRFVRDATALVSTVGQAEISAACDGGRPPPCPLVTRACTVPASGGPSHVYLPNPCDPAFRGEQFAALFCHETGHVAGWPGSHGR